MEACELDLVPLFQFKGYTDFLVGHHFNITLPWNMHDDDNWPTTCKMLHNTVVKGYFLALKTLFSLS